MSKKLIFVCLALLAITSYASADKLIGSWESSTVPQNEGWADHPATANNGWVDVYVDDPKVSPSIYTFSNDWSSDGEMSLKANVTGWNWFERAYFQDYFTANNKIEFDLFCVPQDGSSATWAQVQQVAFSSKTNGWFNPGASTEFDVGFGTPMHCVLDYSAYKTSTYFNPGDYISVIFAYNANGPVWMYMDNVMVTPEPATIGLLGLGGLALLRRKK